MGLDLWCNFAGPVAEAGDGSPSFYRTDRPPDVLDGAPKQKAPTFGGLIYVNLSIVCQFCL